MESSVAAPLELNTIVIPQDSSEARLEYLNFSLGPKSTIDTLLHIPFARSGYSFYWNAPSLDTEGIARGLAPGHIFGIAGQSNAQGFCWSVGEQAAGDIRLLRNDDHWEHASEPTGNAGGSPWIRMANVLYASIGDGLPVGIVNTAIGGTGLTVLGPSGTWNWHDSDPATSPIYGEAVQRFREAGAIEALCWIQGEQDAMQGTSILTYEWNYDQLLAALQHDIGHSFRAFHLQVAGYGAPVPSPGCWPIVREAERIDTTSVLVGTAVGMPLQADHLHLDSSAVLTVGQIFAEAILANLYPASAASTKLDLYPPILPDSIWITTDSLATLGPLVHVRFRRGVSHPALQVLHPGQYFQLTKNGTNLDSSSIWSRRDLQDSASFVIGLTQPTHFDSTAHWSISYADVANALGVPIAQVEGSDTLFAVPFYRVPLTYPAASGGPPHNDTVPVRRMELLERVYPDPASDVVHVLVYSDVAAPATISILDQAGRAVGQLTTSLISGENFLSLPVGALANGNYLLDIRSTPNRIVQKLIVAH